MALKPKSRSKGNRFPTIHNPVIGPSGMLAVCHQCDLQRRRIRVSVTLSEAQDIINALNAAGSDALAAYFQSHLIIASRQDSEYD